MSYMRAFYADADYSRITPKYIIAIYKLAITSRYILFQSYQYLHDISYFSLSLCYITLLFIYL